MSYQTLSTQVDADGVMLLTLNRPDQLNAFTVEMANELIDAYQRASEDDAVGAIVVTGAGKAFCAGHDLRQMQAARANRDGGRAGYTALFEGCSQLMQLIATLPQPVIAEVQGIATAAGCQLVASCDMAVAAEGVRFGVNGVNIGLFCATPMVALSRAIPPRAAFEYLLTGEFMDAPRARELGLINRIAPPDQLAAQTMALAEVIAAKLPAAVRLGKRAFHQQSRMGLGEAYAATGPVMCENLMRADTAEGIQAFLEKRPPDWD